MSAGWVLLLVLALARLLSACNWNVGSVEVRLVYSSVPERNPLDGNLVKTLRLAIEGDDLYRRESEVVLGFKERAVLSDVPLGANRVVVVEGLDPYGEVKSQGVSAPFDTDSGNTRIYLYFSLVEGFTEPPSAGTFLESEWRDRYRTEMTSGRVFHSATPLPDGTVLIVGGVPAPSSEGFLGRIAEGIRNVERFDATAGAFVKESPDCSRGLLCMKKPDGRAFHGADLLPGGTHVVVAGGEPVDRGVDWPAEYYSIRSRAFEAKVGMTHSRARHASVPLGGSIEGVLIAGGVGQLSAELHDSVELFVAGDFLDLDPLKLQAPRSEPAAVSYTDNVLIIGGWEDAERKTASRWVDHLRFDREPIQARSFQMVRARAGHSAVVLGLGVEEKIFVCGGLRYEGDAYQVVESCEFIYPQEQRVEEITSIRVQRWAHSATVLSDGRVLIAGGFSAPPPALSAASSAVLYGTPVGTGTRRTLPMVSGRAGHTATLLNNGMVALIGGVELMITGGETTEVKMPVYHYEIFNPRR